MTTNGGKKEVKWQGGISRRPQAEPGGFYSSAGPTSHKLGDLDPELLRDSVFSPVQID